MDTTGNYLSEGSEVDVKPAKARKARAPRKRKRADASPAPTGRNNAPRRSGRQAGGKKTRKDTESPTPPDSTSTSARDGQPAMGSFDLVDSVELAFIEMERKLRAEKQASELQAREIQRLKELLEASDKNQASSHGGVHAKCEAKLGQKDRKIEKLREELKDARDSNTLSRLAHSQLYKDHEELKHKQAVASVEGLQLSSELASRLYR